MAEIDVLQTGKMLVSSAVHNRDSKSGKFAYTGLFQSKKGRNDVPVKAFLIRINGKNVLVDTGWSEQCAINPRHHLGLALYFSSQPTVTLNDSVARQLDALGITPKQLDAVILTHLDCDHVSGLKDLKGAKHIYATKEELETIDKQIAEGSVNPRDIKLKLAYTITAEYHGEDGAKRGQDAFINVVSNKGIPDDW